MPRSTPLSGSLNIDDERSRRILAVTIELAEKGGFAAVRLRDVAQSSGVALGTLYKRFRSKEDLLIGVVSSELGAFEERLAATPLSPDKPQRLLEIFSLLTDFLCERPNFGRAVIRSTAAGEQALAERLVLFHSALGQMVGTAFVGSAQRPPSAQELQLMSILQRLWFALLLGWASNIHTREYVLEQLELAISMLIHGIELDPAPAPGDALEP